MAPPTFDEIGYWSEIKLDIVREYAAAYSKILRAQSSIRRHVYIDGFAGAGVHISKSRGEYVPGSPLNALNVSPPFAEYHFIDLNGGRANQLRTLAGERPEVRVHEGDCNRVLLEQVFPRCRYRDFHRALCLLDPYGLNVDWNVLQTAGREKSIEVFYNFMIMDANMNVLLRDPGGVKPEQAARMDLVWGDGSWRSALYPKTEGLFGSMEEKTDNASVAEVFRQRLKDVAGFAFVPQPMPMRNKSGAVVYYLFFASPNRTGAEIVSDIFDKYRAHGGA